MSDTNTIVGVAIPTAPKAKPTAAESLAKQNAADKAKANPAKPKSESDTFAKPKAAKAKGKVVGKGKAKPAVNTAPKSKPMPGGESVNAGEPTREPKWSDRRKNIVLAMRALGATSATAAVTAADIAKAAGKMAASKELAGEKGVFYTKLILDVYRTNELLHNGFAASVRHEGERELRYFLTAKGKTTKFPEVAKKPAATTAE